MKPIRKRLPSGHGAFDAPSPLESGAKSLVVNARLSRNRGNAHFFALKRETPVVSAILRLLYSICPSTVAGFVVAVVVDPVDCHSGGHRPHVQVEVIERITPSLAHADSSATIVGVVPMAWVTTSCLHCTPRSVRSSSGEATAAALNVKFVASTTSGKSEAHGLPKRDNLSSAVASAPPRRLFPQATSPLDYNKPAVAVAGFVNHGTHVALQRTTPAGCGAAKREPAGGRSVVGECLAALAAIYYTTEAT